MDYKRKFLVLCRLCVSSDYRRLRKFKILNACYYLGRIGLKIEDDPDPLWTYVKNWRKSASELNENLSGWNQFADPHPLFDTSYYLLQYFPDGLSKNPLLHYLTIGWKKGYRPGPFFDPFVYAKKCGWDQSMGDPLSHYTHQGQVRGVSPSLTFDFDFYFDKNPYLAGIGHEVIKHYKLHGAAIGKSPLPVFEPEFYLGELGVVGETVTDPLSHYLSSGCEKGYKPARLFDPDYYSEENGGSVTPSEALIHYLTVGVFQQKYPHKRVATLNNKPVISIIVPVYNPDPAVLRNCIRSVLYQAYPHWELCLLDDCSSDTNVRPLLEKWAAKDSRIKVGFHNENGGIAAATNSGAALGTGSYVAFLDNDDELTVDCLVEVVETINVHSADVVYSDEDLIGDDGTRLSVFRKPDFNRCLLLSHNYITHFVAVKRSLFDAVGGVDSTYDGAQDFDLMLKLSEVAKSIIHIPKVLYHWRASQSSTSINHGQKSYAHEAGRKALQASLDRRGLYLQAADTELNFFYRLRSSDFNRSCCVLIWAVGVESFSDQFIDAVASEITDKNVRVIIVSEEEQVQHYMELLQQRVQIHNWDVVAAKSEGKAGTLQQVISRVDADWVCLLDGAIQQLSDNWLTELGCMTDLTDVAVVCGRTRYRGGDGTSYLLPDLENNSAQYLQEFLRNSSRHMAGLHCQQDMSFASGDITLIKKDVFKDVGGFSWKEFADVFALSEYSLRLSERALRVVYTPFSIADKEFEPLCECDASCESATTKREREKFQDIMRGQGRGMLGYYNDALLEDAGRSTSSFYDWLFGNR